jgi:hypothetical protein
MLLSFGGHEMALVVNGTQAHSCGPGTQRSLSGKTNEVYNRVIVCHMCKS